MPSSRTPASIAARAASAGTSGSGLSSSVSASSLSDLRAPAPPARALSHDDLGGALHALGAVLQQLRPRQRRGEQDARLALAVIEVDRHDELLARQRLRPRRMPRRGRWRACSAPPRPGGAGRCGRGRRRRAARRRSAAAAGPDACGAQLPLADRAPRGACARGCARSAPPRPPSPRSSSRRVRMSASRRGPHRAAGRARTAARRAPRPAARRRARAPAAACARVAGARRGASSRGRAALMRPSASSAPRRRSRSRGAAEHGRGRRIEPAQSCGRIAVPQLASSSASGARSASAISGGVNAASEALRALAPGAVAHPGSPAARRGPGAARRRRARCAASRGGSCRSTGSKRARRTSPRVHHHAHAGDGEAGLGDVGGEHHLA